MLEIEQIYFIDNGLFGTKDTYVPKTVSINKL